MFGNGCSSSVGAGLALFFRFGRLAVQGLLLWLLLFLLKASGAGELFSPISSGWTFNHLGTFSRQSTRPLRITFILFTVVFGSRFWLLSQESTQKLLLIETYSSGVVGTLYWRWALTYFVFYCLQNSSQSNLVFRSPIQFIPQICSIHSNVVPSSSTCYFNLMTLDDREAFLEANFLIGFCTATGSSWFTHIIDLSR